MSHVVLGTRGIDAILPVLYCKPELKVSKQGKQNPTTHNLVGKLRGPEEKKNFGVF